MSWYDAVPHSGNTCSGLCRRPPCDHMDCWQCNDIRQADAAAMKLLKFKEPPESKEDIAKLLPKKLVAKYNGQETTLITRAVLEDIVAAANGRVQMDWNDGDPVFRDKGGFNLPPADLPPADLANALGRNSARIMDGLVKDILAGKDEEANRKARETLRASGLSEGDIKAAEKLLRMPDPMPDAKLQYGQGEAKPFAYSSELAEDLRRMKATLLAQGYSPSPMVIVHPSLLTDV